MEGGRSLYRWFGGKKNLHSKNTRADRCCTIGTVGRRHIGVTETPHLRSGFAAIAHHLSGREGNAMAASDAAKVLQHAQVGVLKC